MCVRDGARYLPEALDTLQGQTFGDFELVVVDDGSTDGTREILASRAAEDPRLVLVRQEAPRGVPLSLNRALSLCRAPLTARADADDVYALDRFEKQVAYMGEHPEIGVLSCGFHRIDEEGRRIDTSMPTVGHPFIRFQMLFMNALLHPGTILRTRLVREAGGYDPEYWTAQDSELWARLLPRTRMDNLAEPLVSYRVHGDSIVSGRGKEGRELSLSVPARQLSGYLGRELGPWDVEAAVGLYQGFSPLSPEDAVVGEVMLAEVLEVARAREAPEVQRCFRRRVAASLAKQAGAVASSRAVHIYAQSLGWAPNLAVLRGLAGMPFRALRAPA